MSNTCVLLEDHIRAEGDLHLWHLGYIIYILLLKEHFRFSPCNIHPCPITMKYRNVCKQHLFVTFSMEDLNVIFIQSITLIITHLLLSIMYQESFSVHHMLRLDMYTDIIQLTEHGKHGESVW